MLKLVIVFLLGAAAGYGVGFNQGVSGYPSLKQQALEKLGVYKVRDDHLERQRVIDDVQRVHADSVESAIHRTPTPR